jgi:Pectate lyase superfamily protein
MPLIRGLRPATTALLTLVSTATILTPHAATAATTHTPATAPQARNSAPKPGGLEAENSFFSGGPRTAESAGGFAGGGYLSGFTATGARVVFTANAGRTGAAAVTLRYRNTTGTTQTLSAYANGLRSGRIALPAGSGWRTATTTLALRQGVNAIGYQHDRGDSGDVAIDSVSVAGGAAPAAAGATLPYTEYEAEDGTTNGSAVGPDRTYLSVASEASGRRAVKLSDDGQYVQFKLTQPTNSIVVRYSVPDSSDGTGIDTKLALYAGDTKVKDLDLTSKYSWVYGAYPYNNDPGQGSGHHFFDESRALIGDFPAGTVLKLQKDADDTAASYTIDLIDTEQVAAAATIPDGFVSAADYGVTADDGSDDTNALNTAVSSAKSAGKGLFLPSGSYNINARINVQGVTIRGAGPWYTVLHGLNGKGGFFATGGDVTISDLAVFGDVRYRDDAGFDTGIEGNFGTGSSLQNIWIEHTKVGMWVDSGTDGLDATGLRIRDTFADGVNVHANVANTVVEQSNVRNTGDDGLAMFSEGSPVTRSSFRSNTVQLPMLANTVGIYGGDSNSVTDNLLSDTVTASAGIAVSTRFNPVPFSGTTTVSGNTLNRTGGYEQNWQTDFGGIWVYADSADITSAIQISDNAVNDSTYQGILLSSSGGKAINNVTFDHVAVDGAGTYGIDTLNVTGGSTFDYVTVTGAASGGLNNPADYTINRGDGDSGF